MVDKSVGTAGTLRVSDDGSTVRYYVLCSDPSTNVGTYRYAINGTNYTIYLPAGFGSKLLGSRTYTASGTTSLSQQATGTLGLGGAESMTVSITRALPAAPSGLSVARVSDTQHTLTWTRNATYTSVVVQRVTDNGPWQQIGVPTGNAFTFTDTTTVAGKKYNYRVAGKTPAGQSGWSNVDTVYTTPDAPTGVSASRTGDDIVVSVSGRPAWVSSYDVRDGATVVATGVLMPWTHVSPNPATPHTYTVRAEVDSLTGAYSEPSNTVQLLAAPNAPTGLDPNGSVRPDDADVRFAWVHNPVDSSAQTAYEVRYRVVGSPTWTTVSGATDEYRDLALAVGDWEWGARTKGSHPDWSPWSSTATLSVIDRPGVAITQPETEWDASTLTVEWSWLQVQGRPQSVWELELLDGNGDTVEVRSGSGASTSFTLSTRLTEGDWTVRVRAATGEVWSDWAAQAFTVAFDPPAAPSIAGTWDEAEGGVQLTVSPGDGEEFAPTVFVIVERSIDEGATWESFVEVTEDTVTVDRESLSFGETLYRATAFTAEGATSTSDVVVPADSGALWLAGGEGFGISGRLPFDPSVRITPRRERALKQYAGRSQPVALTGLALSRVVAVSGVTTDRDSDTADVELLTRLAQASTSLFLFRDPDGRRIYGMVDEIPLARQSSSIHEDGWEGLWGYSFTLTEAT
ncbi:fibronectin type III domain-containing protein [Microbacterium sp. KKR3/1]|uniref:fibronectin type III domain-containing protein n=1 Tax=Microbacterium sp. KKR3/1 TaxID=2904241 RepID=UPI001E57B47B|nr:fibronectin type III domain-containing protein [Microbacterium sp. KKR3/1]MCE0510841.1 fibronectin type III domain-containing protein [Microbacterium sp. KKR3/1]